MTRQSGTDSFDWKSVISEFHRSPSACVLAATGGGASALTQLLEVPGASQTFLEGIVPYASVALNQWLGRAPETYCSRQTALAMAAAAFARAELLVSLQCQENEAGQSAAAVTPRVLGVGCTAALVSNRPKRGEHRAHLAVHSAKATAWASLTLEKGARDRIEEEDLTGRLLLQLLFHEVGITVNWRPDWRAGDRCLTGHQAAGNLVEALTRREIAVVWRRPDGELSTLPYPGEGAPRGILSGSFNPRHEGHVRLRELAEGRLGGPVAYEISVRNVDKPPLDHVTLHERAGQFDDSLLALTSAATFVEKSRVFPGCTFVVGVDTAERLIAPRYYGGDQGRMRTALTEIESNGCQFLVAGRAVGDQFQTLENVSIPEEFAPMFTGLPERAFRIDRTSTEIRRQRASADQSMLE